MSIVKTIAISAVAICVVALSGCATVGNGLKVSDKDENSESFCGNPLVFTHKVNELKQAYLTAKTEGRKIDSASAFKVLRSDVSPELRALVKEQTGEDCRIDPNRPIHNVQVLDRNATRTLVFGPTAMASSEEASKMRELTDRLKVELFNFISTRVYASLKLPLNIKKTDRGYNLRVYLVFEDDQLTGAFIEGSGDVNSSRSEIIADPGSILGRVIKRD